MKLIPDVHGANKCIVFLDGKQLRYCSEADDELNYAICAVLNSKGKFLVDKREKDGVKKHHLEGDVIFVFETPQDCENAIAWNERRLPRQIQSPAQIAAEKSQHTAEYERKQVRDQYPQRNRHERRKAAKVSR